MPTTDVAAILEVVTAALKDLLKFKIVGYVNTGDKTQDSLLTAFLLAIMTLVFATFSWTSIMIKYHMWRSKRQSSTVKLDANTLPYYKSMIPSIKDKMRHGTWYLYEDIDSVFTNAVALYYLSIHSKGSTDSPMIYDFTSNTFKVRPARDAFQTLKKSLPHDSYEPVFVDKNGMVCVYYHTDTGNVLLTYTDDSTLEAFVKEIKTPQKETIEFKKTNTNAKLMIYDTDSKEIGSIYPDRTFELFVSRHKQSIIRAIQAFQKANTHGAAYGGYGTYNLGIMLHGAPGTGKTLLIKALANYLKRDVYMIDMRKIKSRKDFENLFSEYSNYVYCLDEFDCVQGAIQQRVVYSGDNLDEMKLNSLESAGSKELAELRERQLVVLKMTTFISKAESPKKKDDEEGTKELSPLELELRNIEKRIKDIENALTLDTILTVLDGVKEMRGRVIIATTNHLDKIDKALMRAGRFDLKINLDKFNRDEIIDMLKLMFRNMSEEENSMLYTAKFKEGIYAPVDVIYHATTCGTLGETIKMLI